MAEATLSDINNQLMVLNQTSHGTNERLDIVIDIWRQQQRKEQTEEDNNRLNNRKKARSNDRPSDPRKEDNFFGALARGEFLRALFGIPVLLTGIAGVLAGGMKAAYTFQEYFQGLNSEIAETSQKFRSFLAAGAIIPRVFQSIFGTLTLMGQLVKITPVVGHAVKALESVARLLFNNPIVRNLTKMLTYFTGLSSFRGMLGIVGKFFNIILILDSVLRGLIASVVHFQKSTGNLFGRLLSAFAHGLVVGAKTFIQSYLDAIPMVKKALNFLFDDLLLKIRELNIPVVSWVAGLFRESFLVVKSLLSPVTSFSEKIKIIYNIAKSGVTAIGSGLLSIFGMTADLLDKEISIIGKSISFVVETTKSFFTFMGDQLKGLVTLMNKFAAFKKGAENVRFPWQEKPKQDDPDNAENRAVRAKPPEDRATTAERQRTNTRASEERFRAGANVVVTDASVKATTTSVSNQTNLAPKMRPYDVNHPGAMPQHAFSY